AHPRQTPWGPGCSRGSLGRHAPPPGVQAVGGRAAGLRHLPGPLSPDGGLRRLLVTVLALILAHRASDVGPRCGRSFVVGGRQPACTALYRPGLASADVPLRDSGTPEESSDGCAARARSGTLGMEGRMLDRLLWSAIRLLPRAPAVPWLAVPTG